VERRSRGRGSLDECSRRLQRSREIRTAKRAGARVVRSVPLLDEAALDAVRQWEFTPTMINGVPVQVLMTVTVNFMLGRGRGALSTREPDLREVRPPYFALSARPERSGARDD